MRYKNGIPDYDSLTPEEAAIELAALPSVIEAATVSHTDWGGDFDAHVKAHQDHRDRLAAAARVDDNKSRADSNTRRVVLYHDDCVDGFTAAWAVHRALGAVDLIPCRYGNPAPLAECAGAIVYLVDFCFPLDEMRALVDASAEFYAFDHHATAEPAFAAIQHSFGPTVQVYFDVNESGASLVWRYFHFSPSRMIDYVRDNDTGRRELPRAGDMIAAIASAPFTLSAYDQMYTLVESQPNTALELGASINRDRKKRIAAHMERAYDVMLQSNPIVGGGAQTASMFRANMLSVRCCNCSDRSIMSSLTHDLALESSSGIGACWWDRGDGKTDWRLTSLRELEAEGAGLPSVDVSRVAAIYGGGGHKHAAGFVRINATSGQSFGVTSGRFETPSGERVLALIP